MTVETTLTIAAQCDRAARSGTNEDNCLVVSPVGCANPKVNRSGDVAGFSETVPLRDKGCLLVVADGMGGMNAGEVASQIAVATLAKCFSETGLKNVELTDASIRKFIRKSVVAADDAIKKAAAGDKEKEGMGTTVALLWILPDNTAYYAWCGDSRIYRHTPDKGLQTLSRDHSYVMEVLHLSEEEAFVHPDNNIITRSLGNPSEKANPEIEGPVGIYKDDLFLLCSDGLCGVLPSRRFSDTVPCIEDLLEEHVPDADHLADGIEGLWTAAAAAGWHDNVTTLLCQVKKGPKRPEEEKRPKAMQTNKSNTADPPTPSAAPRANEEEEKKRGRKDTIIAILVVALIFAVAGGIGISLLGKSAKKNESVRTEQQAEETKQKEGKESPENSVPESTEKSVRQVTSSPAGGKNADIGSSGRPETDEHTKEAPKADAISQTEPSLNFANESKKTSKETSEGKPKNAEAKAASSSTQTGQPELMKTGSDHKAEDNPQTQQTP